MTHVDVLVVGAGLSGIGAGYRLQTEAPDRSFLILERRGGIGGTWDLFRYPGVRSDSDMFTLGFPFRAWTGEKSVAGGDTIRDYIVQTADEFGIDEKIRFGRSVESASWSSRDAEWTVSVETAEGPETYTASFLYMCSGYYDYREAYAPAFAGLEDFGGRVIHPQFWPEDLDYTDKKVVVIGSGATAVTLVPSMAVEAGHVTMLQRSPSWVMPMPAKDGIASRLRSVLPDRLAYRLTRLKNAAVSLGFFHFCRAFPTAAARFLRKQVSRRLPEDVPFDPHFAPHYGPWEQRLCVVPDDDLFRALRTGAASVATGHVETFTPTGLRLTDGRELDADLVVTATGLKLIPCGGISVTVDGKKVDFSEHFVYRGLMLDAIPNFAMCVGYTNASWTLRADLTSRYVCRLLNHMSEHDLEIATPTIDGDLEEAPLLNLESGYVHRAHEVMPKQSTIEPWRMRQNWFADSVAHRRYAIDASMIFAKRSAPSPPPQDLRTLRGLY